MIRRTAIVVLTLCAGATAYAQFSSLRRWDSYRWQLSPEDCILVHFLHGRLDIIHMREPQGTLNRPGFSSQARPTPDQMPVLSGPLAFRFWWRRSIYGVGDYYSGVTMPLWVPLLLFIVYPIIALVRGPLRCRRRRKRGLCPTCGYNLTGNTSGVCPECSTKVEG